MARKTCFFESEKMRNTVFDAEPRTVVDFKAQKKKCFNVFQAKKKPGSTKKVSQNMKKKPVAYATKFEKQTIKYRENDEEHA